jgi:hypothetical protein
MPDKWEFPWFAAWDLAFHTFPFAFLDPDYARDQLHLMLRNWYMAPSGQLAAYEYDFSDVNPPVHAWACRKLWFFGTGRTEADAAFLRRVFPKLLMNFTWWVNRKDPAGESLFTGGFLGMDNIGIFDRNAKLPGGVHLEQSDSPGRRPCHGGERRYAEDPNWKDLILFNEYFHGDTGRGCGASHQTGWTGLAGVLAHLHAVEGGDRAR